MNNINLYDQGYYKLHEFGFKCEERADHNRMLKLLNVRTRDRVLEIGCGFGVLLKKIPAKKKIGIETNDVAVKECCKRGLSVIKADAEKGLSFKDSSFDIVIMNEVLEHLKKPEFVLKECFRILAPRGKIIITTPARNFFAHDLSPTHFSEMTVKEAKVLMQKCRFKVLIQEVCGISFFYPLLENFLFKPFRFLRKILGRSDVAMQTLNSGQALADETFLKPLNYFRRYFLWLGQTQLILAQKKA